MNTLWVNPIDNDDMNIYGFNWLSEDRVFNRLPKSCQATLAKICPNINLLATNTSGGQIHFYSNSSKLCLKAEISEKVGTSQMTAVARGGFDCYVGDSYENLKFYTSSGFDINVQEYEYTFFTEEPGLKLIVINFPLYVGVNLVELGIDSNAIVTKPEPFDPEDRIVIYGTSITQGASASRPGLSFANILSRRLKREIINLGFSGNAFGEIEVAEIIASIDKAGMFIIDYEANGGTNGKLESTLQDFIRTIRTRHRLTPIVVMSRIKYLFDDLRLELSNRREQIKAFQRKTVARFKNKGDNQIFFIDGSKLLGKDYHEFTVDSIHPNDLGFMKMANAIEKQIRKILYT